MKFTVFALFYSVFESNYQVQAPGRLYSKGRLNGVPQLHVNKPLHYSVVLLPLLQCLAVVVIVSVVVSIKHPNSACTQNRYKHGK